VVPPAGAEPGEGGPGAVGPAGAAAAGGPAAATPRRPATTGAGAAPARPGGVLLRDDFTDTSSGWPLESRDPSARRLGYEAGEYVVTRLPGSGGAAFVAHPEVFDDFQVELDARL